MENEALRKWLCEVLQVQCKDGIVVLSDGTEASVEFDGECVSAYVYVDDEPAYKARIRLVPETD